jgi:alpha-amylase
MYGLKIHDVFKDGGQLQWLETFGESWNLMPSNKAVVFTDNHDNQRGHGGGGVMTHEWGDTYGLANVFMLAWPYGYPKVMSSYAMPRHSDGSLNDNAGPPSVGENTKSVWVQDGSDYRNTCFDANDDWVCEHRWRQIANMVDFRNYTVNDWSVNNWWDNDGNQIAFGRGDAGFVVINKESYQLDQWLQTGLPAGDYCNVIKGDFNYDTEECSGPTITVYEDGKAHFVVEPYDAAAIHIGAKPSPCTGPDCDTWKRTVVYMYGQTNVGQDMFIRGGIDHGYAASIGKNCTATNYECAMPIRHLNYRNGTTYNWKQNDNYLDWYGIESGQGSGAEGSALDWTTTASDSHPNNYDTDGYGKDSENRWGAHYWKFEVEMDCSKTVDDWFELKSYISNGPGWEGDVSQSGTPYQSGNHFAKCGHLNVFRRGENNPLTIEPIQ